MASTIEATASGVVTSADTSASLTLKATNDVAVQIGSTTAAAFNTNGLFFRNRIINGGMRIDQRNAGAAVTASGSYPIDRFPVLNTTDGAFSAQQDSSVPSGSGFVNSVKITATTADATLTTTQNLNIQQTIEGTNSADFMWGTASARTVTLSFWVRSSLTGTFGGGLRNGDSSRSYVFTYSISVADTWEYKTVTIAGDTSGTWLTTTGRGINVVFCLGGGPTISGTAGSWAGANYITATGAVSVIGTLNATFYITGVQLESGSVATPFERRPYGTELMLCQRYCYSAKDDGDGNSFFAMGMAFSTTSAGAGVVFPVTMRASPSTLTTAGSFNVWSASGAAIAVTSLSLSAITNPAVAWVSQTVASGLVAGNATGFYAASTTAQLIFSAEL